MRFLLLMLLLSGCANLKMPYELNGGTAESPADRMQAKHDAMIGQSEDDLVQTYGAPDDVKQVGSFKVYYYYTDRGTTSTGTVYRGFATARTQSHGQSSRFYFKNGICDSWDYDWH